MYCMFMEANDTSYDMNIFSRFLCTVLRRRMWRRRGRTGKCYVIKVIRGKESLHEIQFALEINFVYAQFTCSAYSASDLFLAFGNLNTLELCEIKMRKKRNKS